MIFYLVPQPDEVATDFVEFLYRILELLGLAIGVINDTAARLDSIDFNNDFVFVHYLGYAKYVMGTPLYTLFTTVILIAIGVTLWTYLLKGIGYLKHLLPW